MTDIEIQQLAEDYVTEWYQSTQNAVRRQFGVMDYIQGFKAAMELWKGKADKWDALYEEVSKCYCNKDGEYDEDNPETEDADLCTIGEIACSHLGWSI